MSPAFGQYEFICNSQWLLFNANSAIFQLYHGENKLIFQLYHGENKAIVIEIIMSALY
jgi:hypothetical protein